MTSLRLSPRECGQGANVKPPSGGTRPQLQIPLVASPRNHTAVRGTEDKRFAEEDVKREVRQHVLRLLRIPGRREQFFRLRDLLGFARRDDV